MNADYDLPRSHESTAQLSAWLRESCETTLRCHEDYGTSQWVGPYLPIVNPPLWEMGHVAWFLERWCLRRTAGADEASIQDNADALYDSMRIAHAARWFLPLPSVEQTLAYLKRVTETVLERMETGRAHPNEGYFIELCIYHQDMHNEAFRYTRQTLGYPNPFDDGSLATVKVAEAVDGDVRIPAGKFTLGSNREDGWVFDNEKWAHEVHVPEFDIARCAATNAQVLSFVEDGGYDRESLWSEEGWRWRRAQGCRHPIFWRRSDGWEQRVFDRWRPLALDAALIHVNAYEAEAYCRWAGRRLPSEAEWERAAATSPGNAVKRRYPWGNEARADRANLNSAGVVSADAFANGAGGWGCLQMVGNVWEWTSTAFGPYPGFSADPYEDYSQPWFHGHRVLRGGSFATLPRIARNAYRNFYTLDRSDIFAGFRTCALSPR